jgi:hypothetical protein
MTMLPNKSLATPINSIASRQRDGVQPASPESLRGSAIADYVIGPACLSSGRSAKAGTAIV